MTAITFLAMSAGAVTGITLGAIVLLVVVISFFRKKKPM